MVEDFKHVRYEDDSSIRNAEVSSSMDVSGTAGSPGDGVTPLLHVLLSCSLPPLSPKTVEPPFPQRSIKDLILS